MKISILCSNKEHPVMKYLIEWKKNKKDIDINIVDSSKNLDSGEILFLISCHEIIKESILNNFQHTLVLHASDLPKDRGWSPYIWNILEGQTEITVSLLEASKKVDEGSIWKKDKFEVASTDLHSEINHKLFTSELKLMDFALASYKTIRPSPQNHSQATYRTKREPLHSEIDATKSLTENFNKIRTCDPMHYPAFFYHNGVKYYITLSKVRD